MLYDYKCTKCGHVQEEEHPMAVTPRIVCTKCCGKCKQQLSASTFVLKGVGWAKDGYGGTGRGMD